MTRILRSQRLEIVRDHMRDATARLAHLKKLGDRKSHAALKVAEELIDDIEWLRFHCKALRTSYRCSALRCFSRTITRKKAGSK